VNSNKPFKKILSSISILCLSTFLASCGGGGGDDGNGVSLFTVGGAVSGLTGSVTLQNNGGDSITINTNGNFTFATSLADGSVFQATVSTHPVGQVCNIGNGSGTVSAANVSNITVTCIVITAPPLTAALLTLGFDIKTFRFTWEDVNDAAFYRLMENPGGLSGFTQISGDLAQGVETFDHTVALYLRAGASYFLESCNSLGCTAGATISIADYTLASAIGYFKSSNTATGDEFGIDVALSSDGNTLAVGARNELGNTGAVYVFAKIAESWIKQSDITATVSAAGDEFGTAVSLSADGNLLAVGAPQQGGTGSAYTFTRTGNTWSQQDTFKASPSGIDSFGDAVSLSDDGATLAVGARAETSVTTGVGSMDDNLPGITLVGAVYIFTESSGNWTQQEYIKADNADGGDLFGASVSLSSDGDTLAVGAIGEDSDTSGIGTVATNTADNFTGAVYVFVRDVSDVWTQEEYIKASDSDAGDSFGTAVSLSDDGNTLAVGAKFESSMATVINGDDTDNNAPEAGAAYVFTRSGTTWTQQAYVKASNAESSDNFGQSVSLSADGNSLAIGATGEQSAAIGVNGDEVTGALSNAGAGYFFTRNAGGVWAQQAYMKASNTDSGDSFGTSIELSGDGNTLAVGARNEDGNATGIGGDATNDDENGSGAVYLY